VQSAFSHTENYHVTRFSRPIAVVSFLLGFLLSLGVLNGDEAGRVNLLYLLFVYLLIPLLGAVLSVVSLIKGKGLNIARLLSALPIWTKAQQSQLFELRQQQVDKSWFFMQSQMAALAYACASLLTFLILLLVTDINFVWRSTLLTAEQLLPALQVIAAPWWFWESAQPTIELLRFTQDSRLSDTYENTQSFGQWWAFILATQIFYAFLLRGTLLFIAKVTIKRQQKANRHQPINSQPDSHQNSSQSQGTPLKSSTSSKLADITHALPNDYVICNWAAFSDELITQTGLNTASLISKGPLVAVPSELNNTATQLILVKAWEPPMGELQDYMHNGSGLLYPINLKQNKIMSPEQKHLQEWQRFTAQLDNWSIYLPNSTFEYGKNNDQ
jgi:hypothetical protein